MNPLPAKIPAPLRLAGRFLLGLAIGVLLHYLLYRISLPVQPFIYAAF
jgi:hypothetical protein